MHASDFRPDRTGDHENPRQLEGGNLEPKLKIMSMIKGHRRRSYKSRPAIADSGKLVLSVIRSVEFKEKRYFELTNGNLILEKRKDIYEWYAGGVAPKA